MFAVAATAVTAACASAGNVTNMNSGVVYSIANPAADSKVESYPYYGEHFEVYSPAIQYKYGEVFWKTIGPVPLPDDIVRRYNGSVMAVTGWEVDVVRKSANGTETSVPCYESYNHHYSAWIYGAGIKFSEKEDDGRMTPALQVQFSNVGVEGTFDETIPGVQAFNEHNGNEARQSYHGLPRNTVQPIQSPQRFVMNPMQINTKNPDGSGRGGPLPKESQAPPGALYSGLLECPCTTRIVKTPSHYAVKPTGCFDAVVPTAGECFASAATVGVPIVANRSISDASRVAGCIVTPSSAASGHSAFDAVFNSALNSTSHCVGKNDTNVRRVEAETSSLVSVRVEADAVDGMVNITLQGPADVWFAVGFDAVEMDDYPWTIVVSQAKGKGSDPSDPPTVTERRLGDHNEGKLLAKNQVQLVASSIDGKTRTVVLTRALEGVDSDRYTFSVPALASSELNYISAVGSTAAFDGSKHNNSASAAMSFFATAGLSAESLMDTCLCRGDTGTIAEKGGSSFLFNPQCMDEPLSDLLVDKNPTCSLNSYRGGLYCCKDSFILLDEDQPVPPAVDEVFYKWRFYFEDYNPNIQTTLVHLEWQFGHIEYDVPQAPEGTAPEDAVHVLTTRFTTRNLLNLYSHPGCNVFSEPYCADEDKAKKGVKLIMAGGHCHAPACLDITLYNNDTGELLCRITPTLGQGDTAMDEAGYLWLPPCEWGSSDEGMLPPPVLQLDTNLTSVKRVNSTVGHTGVMAIWQARGAYVE